MNNQECKVRPQIVNVNGDDPVFFPYSVKTSKCSDSCDSINNDVCHVKFGTCTCVNNLMNL